MKTAKIRIEYVVLGIIIIGLLAYLVFRNPDRIQYQLPEIDTLSEEEITKIEINKPKESISLEKADNQWVIQPQGYPVDPEKIKKIKSTIANLTVTDVISESENYQKYGLDKENRITTRVHDKNGFRYEFLIGKQAATYRHTYVKLENDKRVFHAGESFRSYFDETVDSLRNKLVMKFDPNEIREIQLIKGDQSLVFSKNLEKVDIQAEKASPDTQTKQQPEQKKGASQEEVWLTQDSQKGKKEELKTILTDLSNLTCSEFLEGKARDDFDDPLYRIVLKGNQEHTLEIFNKIKDDDDSYPAFSSENPYMFSLSSYQVERFMKKSDDVIETPKQE
jgi:hypothetical protein